MTLGEKIKEGRKKTGLSQEQFAEKLSVSRQAVTKWEADRGMPEITNIQAIAKLFNVSVDYLLDDKNTFSGYVKKESINLNDYKGKKDKDGKKYDSKYVAVVRTKYPDAQAVYPLVKEKKLSFIQNILDFFDPGLIDMAYAVSDLGVYFLVQYDQKDLIVRVSKEFIETTEMATKFTGKKMVIGNNIYRKQKTAF